MSIKLYSRPDCLYCLRAKNYLASYGVAFDEEMLGVDFTSQFIHENYPYAKTYPVVVVDGFYIGGSDHLRHYLLEHFSPPSEKLLLED